MADALQPSLPRVKGANNYGGAFSCHRYSPSLSAKCCEISGVNGATPEALRHRVEPGNYPGRVRTQREVVSYALQRRATLAGLCGARRAFSKTDPCDADPMLIRAALHHGSPASAPCPVCQRNQLLNLNYVFGAQLGQYSGRIKTDAELVEMETQFGEFKVCVVEVCPRCGWNYLITSYLLGDGITRRPPRRQQTVEDIYG